MYADPTVVGDTPFIVHVCTCASMPPMLTSQRVLGLVTKQSVIKANSYSGL